MPFRAVEMWYDEYQFWNFTTKGCQRGKVCGHYTQVSGGQMWETTPRWVEARCMDMTPRWVEARCVDTTPRWAEARCVDMTSRWVEARCGDTTHTWVQARCCGQYTQVSGSQVSRALHPDELRAGVYTLNPGEFRSGVWIIYLSKLRSAVLT